MRYLSKNSFLKSVGILAGGTALGQAILILASPIITRLYDPQDLGVLSVFGSLLGLLAVSASLRYELAIPLPESTTDAANVLSLSVLLAISTSLVTGTAIFFTGSLLAHVTNTPELSPFLWLLPIGVFSVGCYQALNYWALRGQHFRELARTKLNQALTSAVVQTCLGIAHIGPLGLIAGHILGQSAGSISLSRLPLSHSANPLAHISLTNMLSVLRRYRRFPLFSSWSGLLNGMGLYLPALLLAAVYDTQVAGWFALADRVIKMPLGLLSRSVSQVYFSEAARLNQDDPSALASLFKNTTRSLLLVGLLPIAIVSVLAPQAFGLIFGQEWALAGDYAQLLSIMYLAQFVVNPISQTLLLLERQGTFAMLDSIRAVLVAMSFIGSHLLGFPPKVALASYSIVMALLYFLYYLFSANAILARSSASVEDWRR